MLKSGWASRWVALWPTYTDHCVMIDIDASTPWTLAKVLSLHSIRLHATYTTDDLSLRRKNTGIHGQQYHDHLKRIWKLNFSISQFSNSFTFSIKTLSDNAATVALCTWEKIDAKKTRLLPLKKWVNRMLSTLTKWVNRMLSTLTKWVNRMLYTTECKGTGSSVGKINQQRVPTN